MGYGRIAARRSQARHDEEVACAECRHHPGDHDPEDGSCARCRCKEYVHPDNVWPSPPATK